MVLEERLEDPIPTLSEPCAVEVAVLPIVKLPAPSPINLFLPTGIAPPPVGWLKL